MPPYNFPIEELRPARMLALKPSFSSPFFQRDPQNPTGHWPPEVMHVLDSYPHIKKQLIEVLTLERNAHPNP